MSNLVTLLHQKTTRRRELCEEIDHAMSCLFTASLLIFAARKQSMCDIASIPALSKHLVDRIDFYQIQLAITSGTDLRLSPIMGTFDGDLNAFDAAQNGCFADAFLVIFRDSIVSPELAEIIFCIANELTVNPYRPITTEGLIVDLLQSDAAKEPWVSIDHPGVFTKAQVDEEIMLRLVSNRYGSSGKNMGVRSNMFEVFDNFPNGLFTEEQARLIESTQIGNHTVSPKPETDQTHVFSSPMSEATADNIRRLLAEIPLPRLKDAQAESVQDDKNAFKQKVRDLCEGPATQSAPKISGKNKPMNEAVKDGLPTTLKDFMNEKDD